jgi:hypothetical protein
MKNRRRIFVIAAFVIIAGAAIYGNWRWNKATRDPRGELLSALPLTADTEAVVYIDVHSLGRSIFLKQLISWAAKPAEDPDYLQFVNETGFDYERDLSATAIAISSDAKTSGFYAIAKGRFDKKKISAYASRTGKQENKNGRTMDCVPVTGEQEQICFWFQANDRIILTNESNLADNSFLPGGALGSADWQARFERLAGAPLFAVIRQDPSAASAVAEAAPGGFRSPQLASLLSQLSWITIAGKPDGPQMEIVTEGETADSSLAMQLSDFLSGIVLMAQAGLNDPKVQGHLDAGTEEAYQQLLKSADISRIDRGLTKSVRVVVTITPKLLEAARTVPAEIAPATPQETHSSKNREKGSSKGKPAQAH